MAQLNAQSGASSAALGNIPNANVKRSKFDLSRIINTTCDSGMIVPIDWFTTIPGDSFDLSAEVGLETLPAVTNILTPYRVRVGYYFIRNSDCWAGWNTFITRGRSGNVSLKVPQVNSHLTVHNGSYDYSFDNTHSLSSFLGDLPLWSGRDVSYHPDTIPFATRSSSSFVSENIPLNYFSVGKLSALPFVFYQNICKNFFVPSNLLQGNHALFPEQGDDEWRLPYHIDNYLTDNLCNCIDGRYLSETSSPGFIDGVYTSNDTEVSLLALHYACFDDDYFTTAYPWLERGSSQTMDFTIDLSTAVLSDALSSDSNYTPLYALNGSRPYTVDRFEDGLAHYTVQGSDVLAYGSPNINLERVKIGGSEFSSSITADNLRNLLSMSVWQERNGRVDGSYNSMIKVHWNHNPNVHEHKARFIGGFSSYIDFSQVFQTSEDGSTPLGSSAGRGSMYAKNNCGRFISDDYGMVMAILVISPVTTYNTSTERELWCNNVMEDFVFPEFENLSLQPIYKGEIFAQGNDEDRGLFAYQERYAYLKSRYNVNRGLFRLPSETDNLFSASTQSRDFSSLPNFSYQFMVQSPSNTRRDWLAFMRQPMFKVQFASKVSAVRPLAYTSIPNTFGF